MSLTMAQGMKRLGTPIAALLGLALVGLMGTSWFLNRDALRQAVEAQIRAVTGLALVVNGSIDAASPHPRAPRRQGREQLDAVHRDHRAHHEARRRQPGVVLGNQDPGRRA